MTEHNDTQNQKPVPRTLLDRIILFFLENRLISFMLLAGLVLGGLAVAPFDWDLRGLPRSPVAVDAIPDIGENQQIVFTKWPGRSPQDIEDQITYPLTVSLLGIPGVRTIRSSSNFGFSSILIIFEDNIEFYWSRSRVLEKLSSLPLNTLPEGVQPALGPDATALGQVFWYTLEGLDPDGRPVGGWDLQELRSIQDWHVRYALLAAPGVSEVASIGGYVQEYQIDVDPDAMHAFGIRLEQVFNAVRDSNVDVGARTIEVNRVEYVVRGLGFIESIEDIEKAVLSVHENVPIRIKDIATVTRGPALRRGVLDKAGAEAVGGVVVVRYGANPLKTIEAVKEEIEAITPGLPLRPLIDEGAISREEVAAFTRTHGFEAWDGPRVNEEAWLNWIQDTPRDSWPTWLTTSKVTIVPFYDRTGLILETLGTLSDALTQQVLIAIIVVVLMVMHLRSSILVGGILPLAVLMSFIAMKLFKVDANIVALSGIAIAIGTVVDMGIIVCENILKHFDEDGDADPLTIAFRGTSEVGGAVLTALATTIISFLPVFTMTGAEGKLFQPLAFTKTFALIASAIIALALIPVLARTLLSRRGLSGSLRYASLAALAVFGVVLWVTLSWWIGVIVIAVSAYHAGRPWVPGVIDRGLTTSSNVVISLALGVVLALLWQPLGPEAGARRNIVFVIVLVGVLYGLFRAFQAAYPFLLEWCLRNKSLSLAPPVLAMGLGLFAWLGFSTTMGFVPAALEKAGLNTETVQQSRLWQRASRVFPGLGSEFMPDLDEGSFLFMPVTMPHASIAEATDMLQFQDRAMASIPELELVVGKIGRVDSALDPAPISMVETVVNYKSEFRQDPNGRVLKFKTDPETGEFVRDENGELVEESWGRPYRQWRDEIRSTDDIWKEIVRVTRIPGTTSAAKLQPIKARLIMMQSGMRAPMGIKVKGPDLASIEKAGLDIERLLRQVPEVEPSAVTADRIIGKPYLEIDIDRDAIGRYGLSIRQVQDVIEVAIGGRPVTVTVEGRERYPVRVRYLRELRDHPDTLGGILVSAADGTHIPLTQLADIRFVRGPQSIKSEDTFLLGYVLFDKRPGYAEVEVVEACQRFLQEKLDSGELVLPEGVSYSFSGSYENQLHAEATLNVVRPLAFFIIFVILYLQFRKVSTSLLVFLGIFVAWSGGFILLWLYAQPWFLDANVLGTNLRETFQIRPVNLSVAVWVGFLALFGIASDNGVVMATYLKQTFERRGVTSIAEAREATLEAGKRRIRPCLMTTATTLLALLPVITSSGKGSDIMIPMALPVFGGMFLVLFGLFIVPVLYCFIEEIGLKRAARTGPAGR